MAKKGFGKFLLGATIGAGLALLFAPQEGSKTRKELKLQIEKLYDKVKDIDPSDLRDDILDKIEDIKDEIKHLDREKVVSAAKKSAKSIEKKANELYEVAKEKSTPVVEKAADEVRVAALKAAKEVVNKLEEKPTKNAKRSAK